MKSKLRPIMLVGTGSDVGKSWISTGMCRWLKNNGYSPAPFKAQNMSLNSYSTPDNLEIGRAQAVQAEACKLPPMVEMNPILLKPSSKGKSQIVLRGKPIGNQSAKDYFLRDKKDLFEEAKSAFETLDQKFSPIVLEGAGSISELNLKNRDIVNMRMAKAANACVYLVADIDRGGVFGSVYGNIQLLEDWERKLIKGIIINKFRGDRALFEDGIKTLEKLTGVPVLGVLPYAADIAIEEEDSVALNVRNKKASENQLNIAVVQLKYMSNYTDFQALEQEPLVNLYFTRNHQELRKADVIIIPGTKNTIEDLIALKEEGIPKVICEMDQKIPILGICGGFQILGKTIADPDGIETEVKKIEGIGLFDVHTTLTKQKKVEQQRFNYKNELENTCAGYEIHMGNTTIPKGRHLNTVNNEPEGYYDGKKSWGTYMHGILDNQSVLNELLRSKFPEACATDYGQFKEEQYEKLACWIDAHINMESVVKNSQEIC